MIGKITDDITGIPGRIYYVGLADAIGIPEMNGVAAYLIGFGIFLPVYT